MFDYLCMICLIARLPLFDQDRTLHLFFLIFQEIKVLSHLKHPNIVQYYGSEIVSISLPEDQLTLVAFLLLQSDSYFLLMQVGDKFYIYLEYVHPGSINKFIQDHCGAITESVVRNFTRHILCGLAYLHSKKTIHR